ncbi:MAG: tRNA epoxyqueuosine(34) reductase QueG [Muribaculaceae bacterium]|nr:tRNA epoxyqueuosine(34) reductase QueG [Muribaculaceae bacterium]
MNSSPFPADAHMQSLLAQAGVIRLGVAHACPVEPHVHEVYLRLLSKGHYGGMDYMDRYHDLRRDPRTLLEGAQSVISVAIPYRHPDSGRSQANARIASYALGKDYHKVLRKKLGPVAEEIVRRYGGCTRICIDTAPIYERYWAVCSGVGRVGRSGLLIVPGAGSYCFLAEILTTVPFNATQPLGGDPCGTCRKCIDACPGGALRAQDGFDARKCISYLTIEHRGPVPDGVSLHGRLYGCDTCADVCPHNSHPAMTTLDEFTPNAALLRLTPEKVLQLDEEAFREMFSGSPMKRAKLEGLRRNAEKLIDFVD